MAQQKTDVMEKLVSLSKRRGFVFQSSEIYGGTGSCWDYGPLGVELKQNIKRVWWRDFVQARADMVGIDASILMHPTVWKASGHLDHFTDPMVDCRACKLRFRADHVDAIPWVHYCAATKGNKFTIAGGEPCHHCEQRRTLCPACGKGELTPPRQFNLMFKTFMGPVEEDAAVAYLRPETAQAMFVNFENVLQSMRLKLPFGIAQVGRSFRNEITPGNFIFRTREFEQMEIEYFVNPHETVEGRPADEYWHDRWIADCLDWFRRYGLGEENIRLREHDPDELSHYSKRTVDIDFHYPIGWSELMGVANRTDFDLKQHAQWSGKSLTYFDEGRHEHVVPYVIEPAAGVDRALLAFMSDAYREEEVRGEKRVVLRFHPELAPIKVAVFPLVNRDGMPEIARKVEAGLRPYLNVFYDDSGAVGRRYRRMDEVGTPYCVTVDSQTLQDETVTVRDRDSMEQVRVPIAGLRAHVEERMGAWKRPV
ncbi:MAG: glycine--tRNA ligase [Candidatus Latescibacteria bacterium]|nr:glycine--tRNA ligase [Candidatus Latescibacterota bacterium]